MSTPVNPPSFYADLNGLAALKKSAAASNPSALREAARQFESLFTSMVLKSMREAKLGPEPGESEATDTYQDMYDQQLAVQMSQGKGLGLADLLVQQLTRSGLKGTVPAGGSSAPPVSSVPAGTPMTSSASTPGGGQPTAAQRLSFVKSLQPAAEAAGTELGVAPDTLIAQAALETGWGQHMPTAANGASSGNLFGIKGSSSWQGGTVAGSTTEYAEGVAVSTAAHFRAYDSPQASARDLVALVGNSPRYAAALGTGTDVAAYASALHKGGYATDPDYVKKLVATAQSLQQLRATGALRFAAEVSIPTGGSSS